MPSLTYHLVAEPVYQDWDGSQDYTPEDYEQDGFIHCTDGIANVLATANRYYKDDKRHWLVLVIDKDLVRAEVKYEDEEKIYPHIYGTLNRAAIVSELPVKRDHGTFVSLELVKLD